MPITATYAPATFTLSVTGTSAAETMIIERDAAGALRINGGAIAIAGGSPTVANTDTIAVAGGDGNDIITLDETNGAMPKGEFGGGNGDDAITGGSGNDTLTGEANNDTLFGRGGADLLFGGADNDSLTGGDGDDQMFGEAGNDRMIWNPGDDNDLMEGGDGTDTAEVNGGNGAETFTITANGTRVRFDRTTPAPFTLDIGTTESLVLNAGGGDDQISATGNLAALIALTIDGGAGNDTILGGNGIDTLLGGDGNDFIDGNQGNDIAFLGIGDDIFNWDPGDGSDVIEGQAGTDTLNFNCSAANENISLVANGQRLRFTRDVGAILLDMDDVEKTTLNALGGTDNITVGDLTGTDGTQVDINLASTIGGSSGDAAADAITVTGSAAADSVSVVGAGTSVSVTGLRAAVNITNAEGANDALTVLGLGDNDTITATTLSAGLIRLTLDGGAGNDTLLGSQGADTFLGGDGSDLVIGDNGNDTAFLGNGDDVFEWSPGDGNDIVEGQAGFDELRFIGANVGENIGIAANGGRAIFTRDVAAVLMDLDDVERITYNALGGIDNVVIGDMTGTDVSSIVLNLAASGGGGDGSVDSVTVNGSNAAETVTLTSSNGLLVSGMAAEVRLATPESTDRLLIFLNGGNDVFDASILPAGQAQLEINAGLGNDLVLGSQGIDLIIGGDGNDTALMGADNDTFVWNSGDDNDIVEGQAGTDTLQFNGANIAETITLSANGGRTQFFRDVAAVTMDLNDVEFIRFAALGGVDNITVNDLTGTDVTQLFFDLAGTLGGSTADGAVDTITLNGSNSADNVVLTSVPGTVTATGLTATATLNQAELTDQIVVNGLGGNDTISAVALSASVIKVSLDGGAGNDILRSSGDGNYQGGTGDDLIYAGLTSSSEVLDGGADIDTLDTTSWGGLYTINMVTGVTNFSGESFVNFENLISGAGNDTITGTTGANIIRTGDGVDNITASDGDDIVEGGAGADTMNGGVGTDTLDYSSSNAGVTVSLSTGQSLNGHAQGDIFSNFENLSGSAFGDILVGDNLGNNILSGGAGADTLSGLQGNDFLVGGAGNDIMIGGQGDDTYYVDDTGDSLSEAAGAGNDRIAASISFALAADSDIERIEVVNLTSINALDLTGSGIGNIIYGNDGVNILRGEGGNDELRGFGGDDFLVGGPGIDLMVGGLGNDTFYVDDGTDAIGEIAGQGNDRIAASVSFVLSNGADVEILEAVNVGATTAFDLTGSDSNNTITGNAGVNFLRGEGGNDILSGAGGDDFLVGGAGNDVMNGGLGNDTYYVDAAGDVVNEFAGEGTADRVVASGSYALAVGANVELMETATQSDTSALNLTGSSIANIINGNNGANWLDGRAGNDILNGFGGADTFQFATALGAGNVDTIIGFVTGSDRIALDRAIFAALGPVGALNAGAFFAGAAAHEADDRIIYNAATGGLFYDADGDLAGAAVQFATLSGNPALAASDFIVI